MEEANNIGENELKASTKEIKNGDICMVEITGLGHNGEGIGKINGFTVFVPGGLPGEALIAKIIKVKSRYAIGKIKEIQVASLQRQIPECTIYEKCGGCQLQHLSYEGQLLFKRQRVEDALKRIAKQPDIKVPPVMPSFEKRYYRNKMQAPVAKNDQKVCIGCYAQGSHQVIDAENCLIQDKLNNKLLKTVKQILQEEKISIYDEKTGKGLVRHIIGRVGTKAGKKEILLVLVTNSEKFFAQNIFVERLRKAIPELVGIVQNINNKVTNVVLGKTEKLLWGQAYFTEELDFVRFNIATQAFFQINTLQAKQLYRTVADFAKLSGTETVIDAYSGTGTIALYLAQKANKVYAIEEVKAAVINAQENAKLNNINNVECICGDVLVALRNLTNILKADVLVIDPPRAGLGENVVSELLQIAPQKIIYVSCHPETMARDIAILCNGSYELKEIQPVDMFPETVHVECCCLLSRTDK